jgi:hypothetical protein
VVLVSNLPRWPLLNLYLFDMNEAQGLVLFFLIFIFLLLICEYNAWVMGWFFKKPDSYFQNFQPQFLSPSLELYFTTPYHLVKPQFV